LEETHEAYNYFRTEIVRTYLKEINKSDVLEVVIPEAVRAVKKGGFP
jgi:hypothetical protein